MPRRENCASACMNQIRGWLAKMGVAAFATAATSVGGSSVDMSVTLWIVSRLKNLVDGVHLIRVTNCSFYMKNY